MTDGEKLTREPLRPVIRAQARSEQPTAAWFIEDLGATLTLVAILIGIVVVRLVTIG